MRFPCYIPLVAHQRDPRKMIPPGNHGRLLIFTQEAVLSAYLKANPSRGPVLRMTIPDLEGLVGEVTKASLSGRFHSVELDQGGGSTGSRILTIPEFQQELASLN